MSKYAKIALVIVLALAAFLRFYRLDTVPPGIYPDEAIKGIEGLEAVETGNFQVFYPTNNGREGLWINLIGIAVKTYGPTQFSLRFWAAIFGTLTVLGLFLLARELFRNSYFRPQLNEYLGGEYDRIALLSAFFLAVSHWHVNFSRIGFRAIMVPLLLCWSFYFLLRALRKADSTLRQSSGQGLQINDQSEMLTPTLTAKSYKLLAITGGFLFGLGFHTYIAFRIAPILLLAFLVLEFIKFKKDRKNDSADPKPRSYKLKAVSLFLLAAFLTALPMAVYFATHSQDFLKRDGAKIGVFEQAEPLKAFAKSIGQTVLMFNVKGDCNWRHNLPCRPELGFIASPFFLVGLWIALNRIWYLVSGILYNSGGLNSVQNTRYKIPDTTYAFLLSWFTIFLLPEVLTAEGIPHALRAIGVLPPVIIFTALGFLAAYDWLQNKLGEQKKRLAMPIALIILISAAALTTFDYFVVWANKPKAAQEFTQSYVRIAEYLKTLPVEVPKFIIINRGDVKVGNVTVHAQTVKYILLNAPDIARSVTYLPPEDIGHYAFPAGSILIPLYNEPMIAETLKMRYPFIKDELHGSFVEFML